jgi:hypothetical protein
MMALGGVGHLVRRLRQVLDAKVVTFYDRANER